MKISLHKNSKTTIKIREEIQTSSESVSFLARKYSLDWKTVNKWKNSKSLLDKSSRPKNLRTDLREVEEEKICFLRKQFKYTIDEIYIILESEFKDRSIYPMKIYRCLKRNGLNVLPKEFVEAERKIKKFKKYGIGYLHIDFIYTRRISRKRYYIFTCIDRVSKLAFVLLTNTKKITESVRFLNLVHSYYPYKINYILTDNGSEFTKKGYTNYRGNKTNKQHPFEKQCIVLDINLRQTKFNHPWTNGMVERFNRKIKDNVMYIKYFNDVDELAVDLVEYINRYNFRIRLKGLNYKTPIQYLIDETKVNPIYIDDLIQSRTTYRY